MSEELSNETLPEETAAPEVEPVESEIAPEPNVSDDTESEPAAEEPPADNGGPVAKARKEAARYRSQLREVEASAAALRDQLIEQYLGDGGVTIKALESAGVDLTTLIGDTGRVDAAAVTAAATTAREAFGIPEPSRFQGTADQGRIPQVPSKPAATWGSLLDTSGTK